MPTNTLAHQLELSGYVFDRNLEGLSHEESLVRPRQGGNCLNWVLGHVTRARNLAVGGLGQKQLFPTEDFAAYDDNGGRQFTNQTAIPFDELKRRFMALQEPLVRGLNEIPPNAMARPAPFSPSGDPNETLGSLLEAMVWHEAYHLGQIGLLRRIVGKEGAIKPAPMPAVR